MAEKNFLNLHILISHSPSCLNRDDMNMQKSSVFGGVRRVRISSQSIKRAMRTSPYYAAHLGPKSDRTRELGLVKEKYVKELAAVFPADLVTKTVTLVAGVGEVKPETQAGAVAPWAAAEVEKLCEFLKANEAADFMKLTDKEKEQAASKAKKDVDKDKKQKLVLEEEIAKNENDTLVKKIKKALEGQGLDFLRAALRNAKDIAFSGRMATSGLMTPIDGALAMSHALTTHAVDADIDWFTAVDDLKSDEGETGAGHLNTQEFSAGVFYRYASLNLGQLQENLGGITRAEALTIGKHLLHMLATVVPTAKQQSFAAHNVADFALATLGDQPISLANAFESPVEPATKGGFLRPSVDRLADYWSQVHEGYDLGDRMAAFCLAGGRPAPCFKKLSDLEMWVERDGAEEA